MSKGNNSHRTFTLLLKQFRDLHRKAGALFFVFFFVIAITGLILGWKKNAGELIMPVDREGSSIALNEWKPLAELEELATIAFKEYLQQLAPNEVVSAKIDRMDVRPSKGIIKIRFEPNYWEVQMDGQTGKVLSIGKRHSDLIEKIHDGSILEDLFNMKGFKLAYTSILSLTLMLFTITGFWMWYGPKRIRSRLRQK